MMSTERTLKARWLDDVGVVSDAPIDVALHVTVAAGQVLVCAATIGEDRHADAALTGSGDGVEDVTIVVVTL